MRKLKALLALCCCLLVAGVGAAETIDFEGLPRGLVLNEVFGDAGSGPVLVHGTNPFFPEWANAAVIFDSSNPVGAVDLGTPNEFFGGPGIGPGGEPGTYVNDVARGNILVVGNRLTGSEVDGIVDNPVDVQFSAGDGVTLSFDFSVLGTVTVQSLTFVDIDGNSPNPRIELFDAVGGMIAGFPIPNDMGDNGVVTVPTGPTSGVASMTVWLQGSGSVGSIMFDRTTACGDSVLQPGEFCEPPGSTPDPDHPDNLCRNDCTYCGDGVVNDGEECDFNDPDAPDSCTDECMIVAPTGCRFTGGGVDTDGNWDHTLEDGTTIRNGAGNLPAGVDRYQFGGQAGAHTALPPQPAGEWTHHQQRGPSGRFTFHGGTSSAPEGTEIIEIRCSDPEHCNPARHAPAKQLDFDGIGTFKSMGRGNNTPIWEIAGVNAMAQGHGNQAFNGTYHYFEVNIDDLGEPGRLNSGAPDSVTCPSIGFGEKGAQMLANCECPDFYRITIYDGVDKATLELAGPNTTDVIYEAYGFIDGGNLQIHPLTGFDN